MANSAPALVRLSLDLEERGEGDLDLFNALVSDLDLNHAKAAVQELALLVAALLIGLRDRSPGIDINELVERWALRMASEETP